MSNRDVAPYSSSESQTARRGYNITPTTQVVCGLSLMLSLLMLSACTNSLKPKTMEHPVTVVYAAHNIGEGHVISTSDLENRLIDQSDAALDAYKSSKSLWLKRLVGAKTNYPIFGGQYVSHHCIKPKRITTVYAIHDIPAGVRITPEFLEEQSEPASADVSNNGDGSESVFDYINKTTKIAVKKGDQLTWEDLVSN